MTSNVSETMGASSCERCGRPYAVVEGAPGGPLRRIRVVSKAIGQFARRDRNSLSDAIADVELDEHLEFLRHNAHFCLVCRLFTCASCWNEAERRCLSCAPVIGREAVPIPVVASTPRRRLWRDTSAVLVAVALLAVIAVSLRPTANAEFDRIGGRLGDAGPRRGRHRYADSDGHGGPDPRAHRRADARTRADGRPDSRADAIPRTHRRAECHAGADRHACAGQSSADAPSDTAPDAAADPQAHPEAETEAHPEADLRPGSDPLAVWCAR